MMIRPDAHQDVHSIVRIIAHYAAQGLMLPVSDLALLFVVMAALVPASINGWGIREIAVVGVLAPYGGAPEQALVQSLCFGLTQAMDHCPEP